MSRLKEWIILNCIIPVADIKFGTALSSSYRQLSRMRKWSSEDIKRWQTENMKLMIEHVYKHVPYYKKMMDDKGLKPSDFNTLEDLKKLPVLTKDIIRIHYSELIPDNIENYPYHKGATGGSTGTPMRYLNDNKSWSMTNAFNILQRQHTGYHYGDKFIAMGGSSIGAAASHSLFHRLYYGLIGKYAMGSPGLNQDEMKRYFDFIRKNRIRYIYGYASIIYLFAKYVIDNNLQGELKIKAVFPTSDILTQHYAETIRNAFSCKILDSYGAFDGCVSGFKSLEDNKGFLCGYGTYIETDNTIGPGYGRILVTDLVGQAFPFLRYDLGDIVEIDLEKCYSDAHNGQVLKTVQGRESNLIRLKNGFYISEASLHNAFKDIHIDGYRVEVADLNVVVTIVPSWGYNREEEEEMKRVIADRTGNSYNIVIKHSKMLERSKNGKSLFIMMDSTPPPRLTFANTWCFSTANLFAA